MQGKLTQNPANPFSVWSECEVRKLGDEHHGVVGLIGECRVVRHRRYCSPSNFQENRRQDPVPPQAVFVVWRGWLRSVPQLLLQLPLWLPC